MAVSETDALRMARDFVVHALDVTGMSSYALAREAGISHTTLTRLVNGSAKKFTPRIDTLNKIAAAAGLTPPSFNRHQLPAARGGYRQIAVLGRTNYGTFVKHRPVEERLAVFQSVFPISDFRNVSQLRDTRYRDASWIVVAPLSEGRIRLNDDVVVRCRKDELFETTLREVTLGPDGELVLRAHSSDPQFAPVPIPRSFVNGSDGIEILGVVVGFKHVGRFGQGAEIDIGADVPTNT